MLSTSSSIPDHPPESTAAALTPPLPWALRALEPAPLSSSNSATPIPIAPVSAGAKAVAASLLAFCPLHQARGKKVLSPMSAACTRHHPDLGGQSNSSTQQACFCFLLTTGSCARSDTTSKKKARSSRASTLKITNLPKSSLLGGNRTAPLSLKPSPLVGKFRSISLLPIVYISL